MGTLPAWPSWPGVETSRPATAITTRNSYVVGFKATTSDPLVSTKRPPSSAMSTYLRRRVCRSGCGRLPGDGRLYWKNLIIAGWWCGVGGAWRRPAGVGRRPYLLAGRGSGRWRAAGLEGPVELPRGQAVRHGVGDPGEAGQLPRRLISAQLPRRLISAHCVGHDLADVVLPDGPLAQSRAGWVVVRGQSPTSRRAA